MKNFTLLLLVLLVCAVPAFANVTITSPDTGAEVVSPFHLVATASECSSQIITSVGYSIDNSTNWTIVRGSLIDTDVASITGAHTVNVKSWGRGAQFAKPRSPSSWFLIPQASYPRTPWSSREFKPSVPGRPQAIHQPPTRRSWPRLR